MRQAFCHTAPDTTFFLSFHLNVTQHEANEIKQVGLMFRKKGLEKEKSIKVKQTAAQVSDTTTLYICVLALAKLSHTKKEKLQH